MNDQISRQKLIESIKKWQKEAEPEEARVMEDIICLINDQPPADQWIPCSLATPKPFNNVLVTYDDRGSVDCLHLEYDNKWHDDGWLVFEQSEILAWMPLPEPYKGVE